jgi:hypothetical protein
MCNKEEAIDSPKAESTTLVLARESGIHWRIFRWLPRRPPWKITVLKDLERRVLGSIAINDQNQCVAHACVDDVPCSRRSSVLRITSEWASTKKASNTLQEFPGIYESPEGLEHV